MGSLCGAEVVPGPKHSPEHWWGCFNQLLPAARQRFQSKQSCSPFPPGPFPAFPAFSPLSHLHTAHELSPGAAHPARGSCARSVPCLRPKHPFLTRPLKEAKPPNPWSCWGHPDGFHTPASFSSPPLQLSHPEAPSFSSWRYKGTKFSFPSLFPQLPSPQFTQPSLFHVAFHFFSPFPSYPSPHLFYYFIFFF